MNKINSAKIKKQDGNIFIEFLFKLGSKSSTFRIFYLLKFETLNHRRKKAPRRFASTVFWIKKFTKLMLDKISRQHHF